MAELRGRVGFLQGQSVSYTPGQGRTRTFKFGGSHDVMKGQESLWRGKGRYSTRFRSLGKFAQLEVSRREAASSNGLNLSDRDRWSLATEAVTQDLFAHPDVAFEANNWGGTDGPEDFRDTIEEAVKDGDPVPSTVSGSAIAVAVYHELRRGASSYETETLVLRRTRQTQTTVSRPPILDNNQVWSTGALSGVFDIPAGVLFNLPPNPAITPTNTAWGWRIGDQSLDAAGNFSKFEDVLSFTFAAWSMFYYTLVA